MIIVALFATFDVDSFSFLFGGIPLCIRISDPRSEIDLNFPFQYLATIFHCRALHSNSSKYLQQRLGCCLHIGCRGTSGVASTRTCIHSPWMCCCAVFLRNYRLTPPTPRHMSRRMLLIPNSTALVAERAEAGWWIPLPPVVTRFLKMVSWPSTILLSFLYT